MSRTRVKICGITRIEDGLAAVAAGADAIGLVFYAPSPRAVEIEQAAAICAQLPAFVTTVGLFVDADDAYVQQVLSTVPLQLLQFHGDESPEQCERVGRPYIKAIRMSDDADIETTMQRYPGAAGFLLDSFRPGVPGGTGETFDWSRIPEALRGQIVLAGGLQPDNVAAAVKQMRPYAVDVSGGVELSKGIKSAEKIEQFMSAVAIADRAESDSE